MIENHNPIKCHIPENTVNPSNPGIGIILNTNRNRLMRFVSVQKCIALMLRSFFTFKTINAVKNNIRLTPGPANAISVLCIAVAFPPMLTYAGTKNMNGDPASRNTTAIASHIYAALNTAVNPKLSAVTL